MAFNQFPSKGGIPSGNTAARPSNPVIGDTYYNGQLEILEIFNGTTFVAASAPPSTPSIATPTDLGNIAFASGGSLTTVFTPGSGGGSPGQYNAFTVAGGFSASSSSTTVTLTGLTPGTAFTVYGNAQNNFGTTVNTPNAAVVTATTLPEVRTIGTATAHASINEVTVTWTNGSNGGKVLSSITITPFLNGVTAETARTAATTSSTSYTFTLGQLTAGAAYTFKVKATNANGTSADSTATNSATMPNYITTNFLVVAGGGSGGGSHNSAGGGAGGLRSSVTNTGGGGSLETALSLAAGDLLTITVGAGGAQSNSGSGSGIGFPGNNSSIARSGTILVESIRGGNGGSSAIETEGVFGSGGGHSGYTLTTPNNGTAGQGFRGGAGGQYGSGGGGGAGAVGANGTAAEGGVGGNGVSVAITGSSIYYAGGGGGADYQGSGGNAGGLGGGGDGGAGIGSNSLPIPTAGTANLGGGGGGNNNYGNHRFGMAGGSGIVVIKLLAQAASTTGNPSNPSTGLYIFNGDGTITL